MSALLIQDSPPLRRIVEEDSDEEYEYILSSDDTYTSDEDEEVEVDQRLTGDGLRYIDSTTIRLPAGKTISHRPDAGFRKSKSRSHKTLTTTSASQSRTQKKLRGNCAMIPSSSPSLTQEARHSSSASSSSSDNDRESSSDPDTTPPASNPSTLSSSSTTSPSSALNNRSRAISHKTIRSSDMQMMASLPATTQRALMATQQRSAARSSCAEHKFQGKMGQFGNIKMTEHFIIDVPFGNRHKCRFPV
ncbi:hypothetical protein LQW54_003123 [Pestalotiopsis sp. IQ-011]